MTMTGAVGHEDTISLRRMTVAFGLAPRDHGGLGELFAAARTRTHAPIYLSNGGAYQCSDA
jgi:hypothetical protein